jgi:cytochrome oxidase Cu insertion factor (SCO1/SenC/PrrC family)
MVAMRKAVTVSYWVLLALGLLGLGCRPTLDRDANEDLDLGEVTNFTLTDAASHPFGKKDLLGKYWVASFIFTHCNGPCPQVSGTMARLQAETADVQDFRLVSFTVDPDRDTPEVLKDYGQRFGADPTRWIFLTGDKDRVYRLIREGFHLGVEENRGKERAPGREVTHSSRLMLVDPRGHVRGLFAGESVDPNGQPVDDVPALLGRLRQLHRERP